MTRAATIAAGVLLALFLIVLVASCDRPSVQYVSQAPAIAAAPVYVQPSHDGFLTGMMVGHMLGSPSVVHAPAYIAPRAVVRNTTIVNKTTINAPAYRPVYRPAPYRPAPSSFGSFKRR